MKLHTANPEAKTADCKTCSSQGEILKGKRWFPANHITTITTIITVTPSLFLHGPRNPGEGRGQLSNEALWCFLQSVVKVNSRVRQFNWEDVLWCVVAGEKQRCVKLVVVCWCRLCISKPSPTLQSNGKIEHSQLVSPSKHYATVTGHVQVRKRRNVSSQSTNSEIPSCPDWNFCLTTRMNIATSKTPQRLGNSSPPTGAAPRPALADSTSGELSEAIRPKGHIGMTWNDHVT